MKPFLHPNIVNKISNYVKSNIKDRSDSILRLWTDQCEYIIAQRFRRGQQMIHLYTRLWEDRALKELIFRLRKQVSKVTVKCIKIDKTQIFN